MDRETLEVLADRIPENHDLSKFAPATPRFGIVTWRRENKGEVKFFQLSSAAVDDLRDNPVRAFLNKIQSSQVAVIGQQELIPLDVYMPIHVLCSANWTVTLRSLADLGLDPMAAVDQLIEFLQNLHDRNMDLNHRQVALGIAERLKERMVSKRRRESAPEEEEQEEAVQTAEKTSFRHFERVEKPVERPATPEEPEVVQPPKPKREKKEKPKAAVAIEIPPQQAISTADLDF